MSYPQAPRVPRNIPRPRALRRADNAPIIAVFDEIERLLNLDEKGEALGMLQTARDRISKAAEEAEALVDLLQQSIDETTDLRDRLIGAQAVARQATGALLSRVPASLEKPDRVSGVHPYHVTEE